MLLMNKVLDVEFRTQRRGRRKNGKQFLLVQDDAGETVLFRAFNALNKPGPVPDKSAVQLHQLMRNTFHCVALRILVLIY